jgi:opacity protein-like surface antigen
MIYKWASAEDIFLMRDEAAKRFLVTALLLSLAARSMAQTDVPGKFVLRVLTGLSQTRVSGSSKYEDQWNQELLSKIVEQDSIAPKSGQAVYLGAFLSYFLRPDYGLEAGLGFFKVDVPNTTSFHSEYTWTSGKKETKDTRWTGTGDLRVIPISLNGFGRWQKGKIEAIGSGGLTLFRNTFQSLALAGFSVSEVAYVQTYNPPETTVIQSVDALRVGLEIEKKSWLAVGANIGGEVDYRLTDKIGLTAGARYFLCPKKDFEWKWKPGIYDGIDNIVTEWEFTSMNAKYAEAKTKPPLKVNPSFFQFGLGIKLYL